MAEWRISQFTPQLDRLFTPELPNFKSYPDPAETSLRNAVADLDADKTFRYQNSLKPTENRDYSVLHFGLDRLQGTAIGAKQGTYQPIKPAEEDSLKIALADIGSQKAMSLQMANRQLAKGNLISAEFILGRKLTDAERATGTIDFLREREIAKAKIKQSKEIVPIFASQKKPNITGTLTDTVMQQHQQAQAAAQAQAQAQAQAHVKARNAMQAHAERQAARQAAEALALSHALSHADASAAASVALPVTLPPSPPPSRPRRVIPPKATGRRPEDQLSQAESDAIQAIL